jgi:hypothetical protein
MIRITFIVYIFTINSLVAQLQLNSFPANLQLFIRGDNNKAIVNINGSYNTLDADKIVLKLFRNDSLKYSIDGMPNSFDFNIELNAELSEYDFKLYKSFEGIESLLKSADNVLCGDAIILYGQSNMVALGGIDEFNVSISDKFMRNFDFLGADNDSNNLQWFYAKEPYSRVGTIGNYFMLNMIDSVKIPMCVINGSMGGWPIYALSDRNESNHSDINFAYGKLLQRIEKSGFANKIRYMAFYQGEAEAGLWYVSCNAYPERFNTFINNIFEDIPSLEKFYEFQINIMHGSYVERAGFLRDFQRNAYKLDTKIRCLTTIGNNDYDGIHFGDLSYKEFGKNLSTFVLQDFYGRKYSSEIESPNIQSAYYSPSKDTITLVFQEGQNISYPDPVEYEGNIWDLKNYITTTSDNQAINFNALYAPVDHGYSEGNKIVLVLQYPISHTYITYLPSSYGSSTPNDFYHGPHFENGNNQKAFSFYCVPILNQENVVLFDPLKKVPFSANGVSDNKIVLSWQKLNPVYTSFEIEVSSDGIMYSILNSSASNDYYFEHNNLISNTRYYYKIRACSTEGCSTESFINSAKTFSKSRIECPDLNVINSINAMDSKFYGNEVITNAVYQNSNIEYTAEKFNLIKPPFEFNSNHNSGIFKMSIKNCPF